MGQDALGASFAEQTSYLYANPAGRYRAAFGWGYVGGRIFGKGYPWSPFSRSASASTGATDILFTSSSGAILGRIRTDIQKTILKSISFTLDERGCANFTMTLNSLPDFPLLPLSEVRISVAGTDFNWFAGVVEKVPDQGTPRREYVYKGFGLRKHLARVIGEGVYPGGVDVGVVVSSIAQSIIQPNTSIGFNTAKIDTSTGTVLVQPQEIQEADISKLLDSYAKMANARWGVDGDGDLYFEKRTETLVKNWAVGYDCQSFEPDLEITSVRNRIKVTRKFSGSDTGWTIGAIVNDDPSQAKYDIMEKTVQLLGVFSDADCQTVGLAELEDLREPKYSAKVKNIPLRSGADYLQRGMHRFINTPSDYKIEAQGCDVIADWTVDASSGQDLSITGESVIIASGSGSLRMSWNSANGARVFAPTSVVGSVRKIIFWVRGSRVGVLAKFGVGFGSFEQHERDISVDVADAWFPIEWDVSGKNISAINEVGLRVLDSSEATTLYIDQVEAVLSGSRHYRMELTTAAYSITPQRQSVNCEFGPVKMSAGDYAAEALARSEENRILSERRA